MHHIHVFTAAIPSLSNEEYLVTLLMRILYCVNMLNEFQSDKRMHG